MRAWLRSSALLAALAGAPIGVLTGAAAPALAQAGVTVEAIEFEGNRRYGDETLRLALRTKVGQQLDRALLPEDINTLYEFFEHVELREQQTPDGVRLLFVVRENPVVTEVVLRGVSELPEAEVRSGIETAAGRPLADYRVENDRRKVERLYRRQGYHFVEVTTEVEPHGEGQRVVFHVLEGPDVQVDEITFRGNEHLGRDLLLEHMATQESGFLGLRGADFVEETLQQDLLTLRNYYRSQGWLDARVDLVDTFFSDDRSEVGLVIGITEGPVYSVGAVELTGVRSYPGGEAPLRELIVAAPGTRRVQEDISDSIGAIERAYREEGFYSAVVNAEEKLGSAPGTVDLLFRVDEASKVRVRSLDLHGNVVTQDKVIRREISVGPGDVLNQNELDKSVRRLQSLGYFERVAYRIEALGEGEDPNQRDVVFEVDDTARTGQVRFAVGASSDLGVIGSLTVTKRNFDWKDWPERFGEIFEGRAFTGGGQTFVLELSPGQNFSSYRVAFTEPWLFDKPISFGWDVFYTQFQRFDYDVNRRGVNFTLGRRFTFEGRRQDTVLALEGTTRVEGIEVDDVRRDSSPTAFLSEGDNSLISEQLSFRVDRLDNSFSPSDGWFAEYSTEFGFAGDIRLWKNEVEGKHYWVVGRTDDERLHVVSLGARLGHVTPLSGSEDADRNVFDDDEFVPNYERFLAGGGSSVRGFEFGGAGPHGEGNPFLGRRITTPSAIRSGRTIASILENDGDPLGGNVIFLTSLEYGFPLYEDLLRGVLFVDAGMVRDDFDSAHGLDEDTVAAVRRKLSAGGRGQRALAAQLEYEDEESFFSDLRVAAGFGLRIRIPAFGRTPIALDFGFPIRKQDGDDTQVLSFSIARDF